MKPLGLITGAAGGIGRATAEVFLRNGFRVLLLDRSEADLLDVRKNLEKKHPNAVRSVALDLGDSNCLRQEVEKLLEDEPALTVLVNNAANQTLKPLRGFLPEELDATWRVNMLAPIVLIQACYPWLQKGCGSVVNVGSISDQLTSPEYALYGASKAFLRSFTMHAAKDLGVDGIRINVVSPGAVDTPLLRSLVGRGKVSSKQLQQAACGIPWEKRFGEPAEIAETIYFLATGPRYLHGSDVRVHGGLS